MRVGVSCRILALLKTKRNQISNAMTAKDVNGETYAKYIRTTYGEQEYPKEIAWLFSKLDEVTREGLQNMVVASLPLLRTV